MAVDPAGPSNKPVYFDKDLNKHLLKNVDFFSLPNRKSYLAHLVLLISHLCSLVCYCSSIIFAFEFCEGFYLISFISFLTGWIGLLLFNHNSQPLYSYDQFNSIFTLFCTLLLYFLYYPDEAIFSKQTQGFSVFNWWSSVVWFSINLPKYASFIILILHLFMFLYEKDQKVLRTELKTQLELATKQYQLTKNQQRQIEHEQIQLLSDELQSTVKVIYRALENFSFLPKDPNTEELGSSPFGLVLTSCFKNVFNICERLTLEDSSTEKHKVDLAYPNPVSEFDLSGLLQRVGDLLGDLAAKDNKNFVINDADFAFRKVTAYGEGIELNQLLHQVVKFAVLSALPDSSIEIGVKIPSPAQSQKDPLYENCERYPFVFQVAYSTSGSTGNIDLDSISFRPLELIRKRIDAKITHFGSPERKMVYVHCTLTLPPASSILLHQQFDQLLEVHEQTKAIQKYFMFFISPVESRFGVYIQSCWQLMGAGLKAYNTEALSISKLLRSISEKPPQSKQICITINGHFVSFQNIVHDLLLRSTGDATRRTVTNSISILYLVSPSVYQQAAQFLETVLSQCHSSFYPSISLILKPIGFRRFASLFVSHTCSTRNFASSSRYLQLMEPSPFLTPMNNSTEVPDSPDSPTSSPLPKVYSLEKLSGVKIRTGTEKDAAARDLSQRSSKESLVSKGSPPVPQASTPPEDPEIKPAFTPLSKLIARTKGSRNAGKANKANLVRKSSVKSSEKSSGKPTRDLSPTQNTRRPGSNSNSYFPQVQSLPIHVLIVEDNPINQKILATFMKKRKIKYSVANDGQEAVEKWKEGGFHIVLMDIQLPVMNGIEATKEIRRIERQRQIGFFSLPSSTPQSEPTPLPSVSQPNSPSPCTPPTPIQSPVIIVALTASSLRSDRIEALAAGCNDFLTKPVSLIWLEKKIMEWGCMQALIDVDGWRRLKYSKTTAPITRALGLATAPMSHSFPASKLAATSSNFKMRSEAMLSKLKRAEEKKRAVSPNQ